MEETMNTMNNEECLELKNIKYKTMLLSGVPIQETKSANDLSNLEKFLETEQNNNKNEPWCKLDKTIKTKKLFEYVNLYKLENKLDDEESELLITFFKDWTQHLFQDNMTWDNYGEWHLDHVKPCASFDLSDSEQVKICFNWKNYQPLWGIDNLIKNDTVDNELIQKHLEKATNYEKSINNIISAQVKEGGLLEQL